MHWVTQKNALVAWPYQQLSMSSPEGSCQYDVYLGVVQGLGSFLGLVVSRPPAIHLGPVRNIDHASISLGNEAHVVRHLGPLSPSPRSPGGSHGTVVFPQQTPTAVHDSLPHPRSQVFNVSGLYVQDQATLSLYSIGKITGCVVDVGHGKGEIGKRGEIDRAGFLTSRHHSCSSSLPPSINLPCLSPLFHLRSGRLILRNPSQ